MIVIVIVGILAAIALPNFLNQTLKAKGSEAKSDQASLMKNAAAEYQQGGARYIQELISGTAPAATATTFSATGGTTSCDSLGGRTAAQTTKFDYFCDLRQAVTNDTFLDANTYTAGDYVFVTTGIGDSTDSSIEDKVITFAVNLDNGHTQLVKGGTCRVFGGTSVGAAGTLTLMAGGGTVSTPADCS